MSALSPLRWPRPKPPSPTDPRHNDKNTSTKRSLNALFGIKSKKHPAEPPSTVASVPSDRNPSPVLYANRPPSKSISSTQSRVDSIGPRTPNSVRESRQSLLTLSDHDPFAGRGITVVASPHSAIGSNRLSIRSNNSLPDGIGGKLDNRALFPPPIMISPKERSISPDFSIFSGHSAIAQPDVGPVLQASSAGFSRKRSGTALDAAFSTPAKERQMKSGSSSTLTGADRPPMLALPTRPPMRARGLTESAATHRSGSYLNHRGTISSDTSSRGLVRQVSLARLGSPPNAPPRQELPPPPIASGQPNADASSEDDDAALAEAILPSALPFIYTSSDTVLLHSPRRKCRQPDSGLTCPEKSPVSPRKLKKAVSHNSLAKLSISTSSLEPLPIHMNEGKGLGEYSSKSSSHQPKLQPLPIISRPPSTLPMPSSPGGKPPCSEQRRGSNSSLPGRRRLFSAPRRPSISQGNSMEDDVQSIFSLRSEQPISPSLPWARSSSCSPSFDDTASDEPSSPQHNNRYTPQHIMSPAAMAEVEASVEFIASPRSRGMSISTITSSADRDEELSTPSTSPALSPFSSSSRSSTFPSRSSSLLFKGSISPPQRTVARPSTSQANMTSPTNEQPTYRPSSSPPLSLISLPPPPRPRQRTATAPPSSSVPADIKRLDTTFLRPSSSSSKVSTDAHLHHNTGFQTHLHHNPGFQTHLQPPRKSLLPKKSMEKFFRRRSLLRKPSFLEIDDEVAQDIVDKGDPGGSPGDSFLDLTRESFDMNVN